MQEIQTGQALSQTVMLGNASQEIHEDNIKAAHVAIERTISNFMSEVKFHNYCFAVELLT